VPIVTEFGKLEAATTVVTLNGYAPQLGLFRDRIIPLCNWVATQMAGVDDPAGCRLVWFRNTLLCFISRLDVFRPLLEPGDRNPHLR
jgi:hypothetical protein